MDALVFVSFCLKVVDVFEKDGWVQMVIYGGGWSFFVRKNLEAIILRGVLRYEWRYDKR